MASHHQTSYNMIIVPFEFPVMRFFPQKVEIRLGSLALLADSPF
jgi:hypothetical protein